MVDFSVVSYNVRGLGDEKKRRKIFNYLHEKKWDIVLLQETHSTVAKESFWTNEWGGRIFFSHGTSSAKGVAILLKKNSPFVLKHLNKDDEGRVIAVSLEFDDVQIQCVSIYAPNVDDVSCFKYMFAMTEEMSGQRIIGGDYNTVLNVVKDMRGGKGYSHTNCTKFLNDYMQETGLVDIWRERNESRFQSTYIQRQSTNASALMERIDYILIDYSLQQFVTEVDIVPAFSSDHAQPMVNFRINISPPGPGYWKLNNSLLYDEVFITNSIAVITEVLSDSDMDIFERWELMKFKVKQCAIKRSVDIAKSDRNKLDALRNKLEQTNKMRDNLNLTLTDDLFLFNDYNDRILALNAEIDEILSKRTFGAMLRCKATWYEQAEKSSKYFFALEKRRYNQKTISRIKDTAGTVVSDPKKIMDILNNNYERLFSVTSNEVDPDYLGTLNLPQVTEKDKFWLDGPIQLEEIHLALKSMNLSKCPGSDGLTVEFYQKFWPMLATTINLLFKTVVQRKILHNSARQGITSLMGKLGRDPLTLKNWRPLSLLNTDYKLFAKVLSNRMAHTASYLIDSDQKGFMKNRKISDNLLNLLTIVEYCNTNEIDALLFAADFNQAFDSCSWKAIEAILYSYGYGQTFIEMIMICYNQIKTAIMNNNYWSKWIDLKVSVRQGCPLSGLLFNHLISALAMKIKQNENIHGIEIQGHPPKKLDMFADDIWNIIKFEEDSFEELLYEYQDFADFSGLKINYDKTEIMRLGSIKFTNAQFYSRFPLIWSDGPVKVLGIDVCQTLSDTADLNYSTLLDKVTNVFQIWQARALTPIGKIQIVNSITNAMFQYKMQVLPSPGEMFLKNYKRLVTKFIWDSKKPKIAYNRLIASYPEGGLQLRDIALINDAIKLSRISELRDIDNKQSWKQLITAPYNVSASFLLQCNLSAKDVYGISLHSLMNESLKIWAKRNFYDPTSFNEVTQQLLWYNSHIKVGNKVILNKTMYRNNINKVIDMIDLDTGKFYTFQEFDDIHPNVVGFLEYNSIVSAIPPHWKRIIKENNPDLGDSANEWPDKFRLLERGKPTKNIYQMLRDEIAVDNSTLSILWNNDLRINLDKRKMNRIFTNVKEITMSSKLRYFQYRILVRALILNVRVAKWDPDVSHKCTFCDAYPETIVHFFYECIYAKKIWNPLVKWCKYMYDCDCQFSLENVILNNYRGSNRSLINVLILIAKFYLYKVRVIKAKPSFLEFIADVDRIKAIERVISISNNTIVKFHTKWTERTELDI